MYYNYIVVTKHLLKKIRKKQILIKVSAFLCFVKKKPEVQTFGSTGVKFAVNIY